jgi:hypothetical protein
MTRRTLIALAWTVLILAACLTPPEWLPFQEEASGLKEVPSSDKGVHFGLFAVHSVLWMGVGPPAGRVARTLIGGLALTTGSELGQGLEIVHRDPNLADGLADALGVIAGIGAALVPWRRLWARRSSRPTPTGTDPPLPPSPSPDHPALEEIPDATLSP